MVKLQNPSGIVLEVADFSVEYLKSKGWTEPKPEKPAPKKRAPRKKAAENGNG